MRFVNVPTRKHLRYSNSRLIEYLPFFNWFILQQQMLVTIWVSTKQVKSLVKVKMKLIRGTTMNMKNENLELEDKVIC